MFLLSSLLLPGLVFSKYDRKEWKHWVKSGDGCLNTRSEILKKRSLMAVSYTNKKKCTVESGKWDDFYYPETYLSAKDVDIDHLIPLKHASEEAGGDKWGPKLKEQFANDPDNLVITGKHYNRQKGAKTISEWMPSNYEFSCRYIRRWIFVKTKYSLKIGHSEMETIAMANCPPQEK